MFYIVIIIISNNFPFIIVLHLIYLFVFTQKLSFKLSHQITLSDIRNGNSKAKHFCLN